MMGRLLSNFVVVIEVDITRRGPLAWNLMRNKRAKLTEGVNKRSCQDKQRGRDLRGPLCKQGASPCQTRVSLKATLETKKEM